MRRAVIEVPTEDMGHVPVRALVSDRYPGLAITPEVRFCLDLRSMEYRRHPSNCYMITHIPSGRVVIGWFPTVVAAYRALRACCEMGVDWTQDDRTVRRQLTPYRKQSLAVAWATYGGMGGIGA